MLKDLSRLAILSALVATTACGSILQPGERELRRIGILQYQNEPASVTVPATATVGVPFQVQIRTYGPGCYRQGGVVVGAVQGGTRLEPFDFLVVNGGQSCPAIQTFEHSASVTLTVPGPATLFITGVSEPGGSAVTLERTVQVSAAS